MADAAGAGRSVWQQFSQLDLKASPGKFLRQPKRKTRRLRRKRSHANYYAYLKERRFQLKTKSFHAVATVDVTRMECTDDNQVAQHLTDVAEWHRIEQVAYWKSRAISLQLENKMLYEHIKNVYAKQINDYEQSKKDQNQHSNVLLDTCESNPPICEENCIIDDIEKLPPKEQVSEQKQSEMKKLYGEMAPKITGMETAVQLNYNRQITRDKPHHWPNIPLKL